MSSARLPLDAGRRERVCPQRGRDAAAARAALTAVTTVGALVLAGCAGDVPPRPAPPTPEQIEARIASLLPASLGGRAAWAADIQLVLASLRVEPSDANICAVLAITEQESGFRADPAVPQLGKIARQEIDRRSEAAGVPALAVRLALQLSSPDGRSWEDRIEAVKTERELSGLFEQMIDQLPLGKRLLAGYNPVRTGGPMQVGIAYAESHARARPYPFPLRESIRQEVFTRRGGLYFGTAHLLDYAAPYGPAMVYRFADFNAGQFASRNAAFQAAVAIAGGRTLDLDGDLIAPGTSVDSPPGETESAVRALGPALGLDAREIRRELQRGEGPGFERSALFTRVFELAERRRDGQRLPRARLPDIPLKSPKFTRKLTTEWFARRVDERWQRCLKQAAALGGTRAATAP